MTVKCGICGELLRRWDEARDDRKPIFTRTLVAGAMVPSCCIVCAELLRERRTEERVREMEHSTGGGPVG